MNSYTLTSKEIKRRIFYSFLLVLFFLFLLDLALYMIIDMRTTKNSFVEEKQSKIKHFELNKKENRDIVFIGDSRTIFHISSKIFKDNGLEVYNFGVSGNSLINYPAFVIKAIEQNPKMIVLNLSLEDIYTPLEKPSSPLWEDIVFYYELGEPKLLFSNIYKWLLSYHMVFNYSEAIVLKSKLLYERFETQSKITKKIDFSSTVSKPIVYDCRPFVFQKINKNKTIVKCSNGDGFLLGEIEKLPIRKNLFLKSMNSDKLLILKKIISIIESHNIKAEVIFEPIFYSQYKISTTLSNSLNDITYLNLSDYHLNKNNIIDAGHFNIHGREEYSKFLVQKLEKVLNE